MKGPMGPGLEAIKERFQELEALLAANEALADPEKYAQLAREYARLQPLVRTLNERADMTEKCAELQQLLADPDPDIRSMAAAETQEMEHRLQALAVDIGDLLLPAESDDDLSLFLEIRAGTGGDEAGLFCEDLLRMYARYAETKNWSFEILYARSADKGGFKEIVCRIAGRGAYSQLQFEAGTHRVQRVPETESQGRIHTSASTVAVLPEVESVDQEIDKKDLRVDTFRSSGAGGQHVNKTDSAIRLTHLPTGLVAECQEERSQHKNRARAMALLQAKLQDRANQQLRRTEESARRRQVGSGDRSERIRTYNFPQARVTDHRIQLTLYKLNEVLEGELDLLIRPLIQEDRARRLAYLQQTEGGAPAIH